jgi:DNA-binding transcriptional ArsR family regulator
MTDETRPEPMPVDPTALKALTHPLRVEMYDLLADGGPATASHLAARMQESTGTTSYHLRILAQHGFIEEDPERGNKRERWWRVRPGGYSLRATPLLRDTESAADLRLAAGQLWRIYARQLETWYRTAEHWGPDWIDASVSNIVRFEGTPEDMAALREDVMEVLNRHADRLRSRPTPPGSARVASHFHVFPLEEPPERGSPSTTGVPDDEAGPS